MRAIVPERVETDRLEGVRLRVDHEPEVARLGLDPRVYATLWPYPDPPTLADVRDGLHRQLNHWRRYGFGLWLLRARAGGELVGRGGLQYTDSLGGLAVEVAWAIVPEHWGQGLATELARAAVATAFDDLGLVELVALTLPQNAASRRVMVKAGFAYDREVRHAGLPHVLYRLRRPLPGYGLSPEPAGAAARLRLTSRQPL
jgi:RimJ/RimL family protein N-acetyltransferase